MRPFGRRRWLGGAAIVALTTIVVIAVAILMQAFETTDAPLATVEAFHGRIRIVREDGSTSVVTGVEELRSRDRLTTDDGQSAATVVFAEGTRLVLAGDTSIGFHQERTGQKRLVVAHGNVAATVAPQPQGQPMLVATANARLEVLGTEFLLDARHDVTELSVTAGRVRLTRIADGASVEVAGGQRLVASSTGGPLATNVATGPGDTWQEDFESGLPADWTRAELTRDDLPPGSRGAVRVQEVRQRDGVYYHIGTPKAWSQGLFAIHSDTHLHVTYKLAKPDWFQVFLSTRSRDSGPPSTATYRFKDERFWWPMKPGEWRTATVPLAAFGRVSDWSEEPPSPEELPFEILFTSKDNNLSLVIDRIWVTRGGPGIFQVSGGE